MIQPNELRVGNKFFVIDRKGVVHIPVPIPFTIATIDIFTVKGLFPNESLHGAPHPHEIEIKDLDPIPLTEERLIKAGFTEDDNETFIKRIDKDSFAVSSYNNKEFWWSTYDYNPGMEENAWTWRMEVKTVHQLQNLFFAITGEELNLQP
jgi:hypothetical protein